MFDGPVTQEEDLLGTRFAVAVEDERRFDWFVAAAAARGGDPICGRRIDSQRASAL
ncbi:MAG TPA: hypothetical protein VHF25_02265 [Nitriliruptorales bacterium]|nr:hypothetical protein [Nitriliruptorales bacterium]